MGRDGEARGEAAKPGRTEAAAGRAAEGENQRLAFAKGADAAGLAARAPSAGAQPQRGNRASNLGAQGSPDMKFQWLLHATGLRIRYDRPRTAAQVSAIVRRIDEHVRKLEAERVALELELLALSGKAIPVVMLICTCCGNIAFHAVAYSVGGSGLD